MMNEEDYFKLSEEVNKLVRAGSELIGELQIKEEENETLSSKDEVLGDYLTDLNAKAKKIEEKMVKALGQMYNGVLIEQEYTIRKNGLIYPYQRQSAVDERHFLKELAKKKDKMGLLKPRTLKQKDKEVFISILDKITLDGINYNLDIDTSIAKGNMQIPKTEVYDLETNYSDKVLKKGNARTITTMTFDKGEIDFLEEDGGSINNRIIHKLLVKRFENEIAKVRERVMSNLKAKKDFLESLDSEVNEKLGRWIMVAQLVQDKIDKNEMGGWTQ